MASTVPGGRSGVRCVVFGSTGYVGARLVPELLAAGHRVRAVARNPAKLAGLGWSAGANGGVDVVRADATDPDSVMAAMAGQEVAYYLVHSLTQRDFAGIDRRAARIVAACAGAADVRRVVHLGGIVPGDGALPPRPASRAEVARILLDWPVPAVVLRAAVILGPGSAGFDMLRYLTERLPVMVTPRWVLNRVQPIAVRDVLHYLVRAATIPGRVNRGFDIGGPDVLTYLDMMRRYAAVAGLHRRTAVPVPVRAPGMSARWVSLVTPVPRGIAVPLIESLVHEAVCHDRAVAEHIPAPEPGPTGYEHAVELALARARVADVPVPRPGASTPRMPSDPFPIDPERSGGTLYEGGWERRTRAAVGRRRHRRW